MELAFRPMRLYRATASPSRGGLTAAGFPGGKWAKSGAPSPCQLLWRAQRWSGEAAEGYALRVLPVVRITSPGPSQAGFQTGHTRSSARFRNSVVDFLDREPGTVAIPLEHPVQRPPRTLWLVRFQFRPPIGQQVEPDLATGLDAEMLQNILPKRHLAPRGHA